LRSIASHPFALRSRASLLPVLATVLASTALGTILNIAAITPAAAQYRFTAPPPQPPRPKAPNDGHMMVSARTVDYDYANSRVAAVGSVQIYYNGTSVNADKVIYDQKTKRLHAEGNVLMTGADGKITHAERLDLGDNYRDGFIESLRSETADKTVMTADKGTRSDDKYTVFENGTYTACAPCRDNPGKPPLWQVRGARIIHNQQEKMLYFEDARLEFFGHPLAYIPYYATPDPSVKRKTGFLAPGFVSGTGQTGPSVDLPFYWAIAPDYDLTLTPRLMGRQGVLGGAEWRQRLDDGSYKVRAYGVNQLDPGAFGGQPGDRTWRGAVETKGDFAINNKWSWGWEGVLLSDYTFMQDYRLGQYADPLASFLTLPTEAMSQLYLTGVGNRSYFDARTMYFLSYSGNQNQVPIVYPVIDYSNVINHQVLGGEVSYKTNFVNLSRETAVFDPITTAAMTNGTCANSADSKERSQCLLRGFPGLYTRLSAEVQWRRSYTDSLGMIWTPFASLRADAINSSISNQPGVSNYLPTGDTEGVRLMPTIGVDWRYPFINVQSWGTTTITPIVQVIARPNETLAGKLPNEDSQSLVFGADNLFNVSKFSGYDRVEGGGRANVGVQATTQFDHGGSINAVFGQSYQLFGLNSYAVQDAINTGIGSGLDKTVSDYVASIGYSPNKVYSVIARGRFDQATGEVQRFEAEARANFDRWSVSVLYGDYAPQAELGYLTRRQGILTSGTIKLAANWVFNGSARWDLETNKVDQYSIGVGYVDDCLVLGANYSTYYNYATLTATTPPKLSTAYMIHFGLRTLIAGGLN